MKRLEREDFSAQIRPIAERYAVSWYNTVDHISPDRITEGTKVPIAEGDERLACLRENVEEATFNRDGIKRRYEQAQRDGLFDLKHAGDVDEDTLKVWLTAIETMKGDKGRCIGELRHWREYVGLAMRGELPQLKRATGVDLIRNLADAKSIEPDRRLPPETDDVPF